MKADMQSVRCPGHDPGADPGPLADAGRREVPGRARDSRVQESGLRSAAGPVDWPALMRLGLGALRLPPEAFWAMTPGEFRRALEGAGLVPVGGAARAMDRGRLGELMAAFPDGARTGTQTGTATGAAGAEVVDAGAGGEPAARGACGQACGRERCARAGNGGLHAPCAGRPGEAAGSAGSAAPAVRGACGRVCGRQRCARAEAVGFTHPTGPAGSSGEAAGAVRDGGSGG